MPSQLKIVLFIISIIVIFRVKVYISKKKAYYFVTELTWNPNFTTIGSNIAISSALLPLSIRVQSSALQKLVLKCHAMVTH